MTQGRSLMNSPTPIYLPFDEKWYKIIILIPDLQLSPNEVIRKLSNSKHSIGCVSNREWWDKTVIKGFYLSDISKEVTVVTLCLNLSKDLHELELHTRIKKICGLSSKINSYRVNEINIPDNLISIHDIKKGIKKLLTNE
jgi:hypothetical protein